MHSKWEIVTVFSFMVGIPLTLMGNIVLSSLSDKVTSFGYPMPKRSTFATFSLWLKSLGENILKSLVDLVLFLIFAGIVGFVVVTVFTGGLPLDPSQR